MPYLKKIEIKGFKSFGNKTATVTLDKGFTVITGPRRSLARGWPGVFAAPLGDMMLTGCFGLVTATRHLLQDE